MGVKGDLKEARACMQGGDPAQAYSMIQTILDSGAPELKDSQVMYAVLVTSGLTALAKEDHAASEGVCHVLIFPRSRYLSFRRMTLFFFAPDRG